MADLRDIYKAEFDQTGNTLLAWIAFRHCRGAGLDIPEWVLDYLSGVTQDFARIHRDKPDEIPSKVMQALRFGTQGRGTPFSRLDTDDFANGVAVMAAAYVAGGDKFYIAYENVAALFGIDKSSVQRYYQKKYPFKK